MAAVAFEGVIETFRKPGTEGFCACGLNVGEWSTLGLPELHTSGDSVLDIDGELGRSDLEGLSEGCGQLGDQLLPLTSCVER